MGGGGAGVFRVFETRQSVQAIRCLIDPDRIFALAVHPDGLLYHRRHHQQRRRAFGA